MFNLKAKLGAGIATAGMMAAAFTPQSAFAVHIDVRDNGALSDNIVNFSHETNVEVNQSTETNANIDVQAYANTGGNVATGGSIVINTGDAENNVAIGVKGGSNQADLSHLCGCEENSDHVGVVDNGALSYNKVNVDKESNVTVDQESNTNANVEVKAVANTGGNVAKGDDHHGYPTYHDGYGKDSYGKDKKYDGGYDKKYDGYDHKYGKKYGYSDYGKTNRKSYKKYLSDYIGKYLHYGFSSSDARISTGDSENNILIEVRGGHNVI